MFDVSHENLQGQDIAVLGPYRPWGYHKEMGGDGNSYPEHSSRILDVKQSRPNGIDYFFNYMSPRIVHAEVVVIIPSHDPEKTASGLSLLSQRFEQAKKCIDGSACLIRHTKIAKLAAGGDRSMAVHLNSIKIADNKEISGKRVLLIDDVMTTGNSMLASRKILLDAGARKVACLALGRTTY